MDRIHRTSGLISNAAGLGYPECILPVSCDLVIWYFGSDKFSPHWHEVLVKCSFRLAISNTNYSRSTISDLAFAWFQNTRNVRAMETFHRSDGGDFFSQNRPIRQYIRRSCQFTSVSSLLQDIRSEGHILVFLYTFWFCPKDTMIEVCKTSSFLALTLSHGY